MVRSAEQAPLVVAAIMLADLVPGALDDEGHWIPLELDDYIRLSDGERAAYDVSRGLLHGDSDLARLMLRADRQYADRLLAAVTVAVGEVVIPLDAAGELHAPMLQRELFDDPSQDDEQL